MSQRLIDRNADLKRLRDEGYTVEVRDGFLLIHRVPYVNAVGQVARGTLVSTLRLAGERVMQPDTHVAHFIGDQPCHKNGSPIQQIVHQAARSQLAHDLVVDRSFSNKPAGGYSDYHHKMSTYATIISGPASSIDPEHTPRNYVAIKSDDDQRPFEYVDTASSRAGIEAITRRVRDFRIALVGVGGTGSYILDLVAKTPVKEIHLFDPDRFYSHNAFRSPGAPSLEELEQAPYKVDWFASIYSKMRQGIVPHALALDDETLGHLDSIDFAFVSIDTGSSKRIVLKALQERGIPFIDSGMGIEEVDGALTGQIRVTTGTPEKSDHVWSGSTISFADDEAPNEYNLNIQIAELNALNAALAVIRWKKIAGIYLDLEKEHHCLYPIDGNKLLNAYTD